MIEIHKIIKIVSIIYGAIGIIGVVVYGIAISNFLIILLGMLLIAMSSILIYGFGILIEYVELIDGNICSIYRDIKTMKNKIVDDCDNVSENN